MTRDQEDQAAECFALVSLGDEWAIPVGIRSIPSSSVQATMLELFDVWRADRGEGPNGDRQIMRAVANFTVQIGHESDQLKYVKEI